MSWTCSTHAQQLQRDRSKKALTAYNFLNKTGANNATTAHNNETGAKKALTAYNFLN
jgi:hypothetical protein